VLYVAGEQMHVGAVSQVRVGGGLTITVIDRCGIRVGVEGMVICRKHCKIVAGAFSSIDAGCYSDVRAGDDSSIIVGENSVASAGIGSSITFRFWLGDIEDSVIAIVGEKGIRPNVTYSLKNGRVTCIQ